MFPNSLKTFALLGSTALMLSGCAIAKGLNDSEKEIVSELSASRYQPASREIRDNMSTQDSFAQAAFWSHEYNLNPADLEAAIKLAAAVRKMGNPGRAIEITQTTRALYPKDPYLTAEYAAALLAAERSQDAIEALDQGLAVAPGYGRLWSLKGAALDQLENYELARRYYARALQITPNDPNVMANLGLSYALAGDPATAETWLRRASAQPGAGNNIRSNLALVMQLQGKPTDTGELAAQKYAAPPQDQLPYQRQRTPQGTAQASPPGGYYTPQQNTYVPQQPQGYNRSYAATQQPRQAVSGQASMPVQPTYQPPQQTAQNRGYTPPQPSYQATQPPPLQLRSAPNPQGFSARSNFTIVGDQDGAPKSAAEAARAAAARSQGQNRRVVVPLGDAPASTDQGNILTQIARNVGPKPSTLPHAQVEQEKIDVRPETLSGRPTGYTLYPQPQAYGGYTQNTAPSDLQQRERRGAARRR